MNRMPVPDSLVENVEVTQTWERFGIILQDLATALLALADDAVFDISSGSNDIGTVSVADYRNKFSNMTWSLTLNEYHNGGVGQVVSRWSNETRRSGWLSASQEIKSESFLGYARNGDKGLYYLAAHETAHVSDLGLTTGEKCAEDYRDRTGATNYDNYANSREWSTNEIVANLIAKQVCERLGFPTLLNASVGYSLPIAPHWLHRLLNLNRRPSCCGGSVAVVS